MPAPDTPIPPTANTPPPHPPAECIYSKTWLPSPSSTASDPQPPIGTTHKHAAADDNAKLIFGTVFSLRNMVRKLGGDDDAFVSYRTPHYKLHYYETASSLRLVMLTDTATLSMRNVLHQIYINLWVEYGTYFACLYARGKGEGGG
jgi:hypothetical protein